MRRTDPSSVTADYEGAHPAAAYADSDVGSSPRSVGGAGSSGTGRPGSFSEEPPPHLRWDDAAFARVKLMCSYGGRILPRPHDNQLRYVGGEIRMVVVSRNISFSELTAKLSRMFGSSVVIKYQLPNEDLDALISVTSDEDLENMMEEYDRLQAAGNRAPGHATPSPRLRLFLFPSRLERSQTATLSEMMESNQSRERWFLDMLNGLPVLSRVRSDASSIISETPDYPFQASSTDFQASHIDSLEEWAAAASYGNTSVPPATDPFSDNKQESSFSHASLFGSLLQQAVPNTEVASAPGSPLPLKTRLGAVGSSSSAPPAVISLLSSMADAASKGLPTPITEGGGSVGSFTSKSRLGSNDSSESISEQKKHVGSDILQVSDKNILNTSVGGAEQFLPTGLMDEDELPQIFSGKGSFGEKDDIPGTIAFGTDTYQVVREPSGSLEGDLTSNAEVFLGQPIFDDEPSATQMLSQNLNMLQLDERVPPPAVLSPPGTSPASAPSLPLIHAPQPVASKFGPNEKSRHALRPMSPRVGVQSGSGDRMMQQTHELKAEVDDGSSRKAVPPHDKKPPIRAQQSSHGIVEDVSLSQILGPKASKDMETVCKVQVTSANDPLINRSLMQPKVDEQRVEAAPISDLFYQQSPLDGLEPPISANTHVPQAPRMRAPVSAQKPFHVAGASTDPVFPSAASSRSTNATAANRPILHGQNPSMMVTQHVATAAFQPRMTNPSSMVSTNMVSSANQPELLKGHVPTSSHINSATAMPSTVEVVRNIHPQCEIANPQKQLKDPGIGQKSAVAPSPQHGNQFNASIPNVPMTSAMPTRLRVVGHPLQQVVEGVPLQHSPLSGIPFDNKISPAVMQRGKTGPSVRPSAPAAQFNFFAGDQSSAMQQSTAARGGLKHNASSNMTVGTPATTTDTTTLTGANPFVDNFQVLSTYPDVLEVPPTEKQQRRQIR
ncbi:hypothetical protein KP509_16G071500 [Ceratopteris richardii]|uniref:PB1 domain-containing protein n=1 Tax=Ceratopteris richardii TaxID=49495 RepID=A0A8T2T0L4_CERRI|nr:hypothetical protein KP509_16G071500 [Ceratopteris richardii]